jgi:hypothetical protein
MRQKLIWRLVLKGRTGKQGKKGLYGYHQLLRLPIAKRLFKLYL